MTTHGCRRYSPQEILNLQNIPSHENAIRLMFHATTNEEKQVDFDDCFSVYVNNDVKMSDGSFKKASCLSVGDFLENNYCVNKICKQDDTHVLIYC